MTRKDYVLIAAAIASEADWRPLDDGLLVIKAVAVAIAYKLADDNPRFDRGRFMTACGF